MSTNNKHKISEKELDNLLGQAFLNLDFNNPKNQELMETISNQVLPTSPVSASIINKAFFTKLIGIIAIIGTSVFIYFHYFSNTEQTITKNSNTIITTSSISEKIIETPKQEPIVNTNNSSIETKKENQATISEPIQHQESTINESPKHQIPSTSYIDENKKVKNLDTTYAFPKLTDKEIKETRKQKEKMTNWLLKQSKDKYALVMPKAAHSIMSNIEDSLAMFYMQNSEVSNLEYRTFLFDLLINGEKETFLKAKPHQELWLTSPGHAKGNLMKDNYFSDKRYNDYPVVNITSEGAELYCKWLSKMTLSKYASVIARLPYENEWIKAAKHKDSNSYPWPGDSIQNRYGCHLANFCIKKQNEKLRPNMKCVPKNRDAYSSAEFMLGDSMMTTKIYSYNPNDYGLYCMTGNVAEMVYTNKNKSIITKGGSWNSDFEQCKLYNHEEFSGIIKANPMTGFRPIFRINQNHSFGSIQRDITETGLQVLTAEEITASLKEKKKMIEALAKFDKDKYVNIPMGSFLYKKDTFSVQSFYMATTEVNNLEYRTFLADLLIQNRTAEYLIAKPNQEAWVTRFTYSFNEPLRDMYFWHPAYDEYPVVNISRKGAELYCFWLTVEVNKFLKENNKPLINDLRLPVDIEWACAARQYDSTAKYANGHKYLRDSKGKYEVNYMCYSKEQCKYDSVIKTYIPKNKEELKETKTNAPKYIDDGGFHTVYGKSYAPNNYGLYCMAGNVSEMVNTFNKATKKSESTGTKGGSWFSCDYFLEIDADDEYPSEIEASPLIGFRPVMTTLKTK